MDQRLIPADPDVVRRLIATEYLAAPSVDERLGSVVLKAHQVEAAARVLDLLRAHGGAVLADATGMGKTFVALAVAKVLGAAMVVAPAALRAMWIESSGRAQLRAEFISYETLSRSGAGYALPARLLILDEAHHARNPSSKRYARIAERAWGAPVLIMTATPIHNRRRDLRALLALFLGSRAGQMPDDEVRRFIVRRTSETLGASLLPALARPEWLDVRHDPEMLDAIESISPAVAAADGAPAHALMILGLIRAWSSSESACKSMLRRRLRRVAIFLAALEDGRVPVRRELESWPVVDDSIQLGFPSLFPGTVDRAGIAATRDALVRHEGGVRAVLRLLDQRGCMNDRLRAEHLHAIQERHSPVPVVAFSQFADTARGLFQAFASRGGVAVVTGQGARIASGAISTNEIVRGFDNGTAGSAAMPLNLLIATDVLSEGLSLRRAGVIVHLDIPWTLARLEQRVGRLRRLGSPYRLIHVYAIGPPMHSGALIRVVRTLQRKSRLTSAVVGDSELRTTMPLFGRRLVQAMARVVRRHDVSATERLRESLGGWKRASGMAAACMVEAGLALALVRRGDACRLLALRDGKVSDRTADIVDAVVSFSGGTCRGNGGSLVALGAIDEWIDAQRAAEMVRLPTEASSAAHIAVLRALQDLLGGTARAERSGVAERVERCRALVTSARGIGAELALQRLLREGLTLDALESLLRARTTLKTGSEEGWRIVALLQSDSASCAPP